MNSADKSERIATDVEKQLSKMLPDIKANRSFAPPEARGIHELINEVTDLVDLVRSTLGLVRDRMAEFEHLQQRFYKGDKT